jgi:hypothetical protein
LSPKVKTVPGILSNSLAVALSLFWEQLAMSPAPTSVTGSVCPTLGTAVSATAMHASSTANTIKQPWSYLSQTPCREREDPLRASERLREPSDGLGPLGVGVGRLPDKPSQPRGRRVIVGSESLVVDVHVG